MPTCLARSRDRPACFGAGTRARVRHLPDILANTAHAIRLSTDSIRFEKMNLSQREDVHSCWPTAAACHLLANMRHSTRTIPPEVGVLEVGSVTAQEFNPQKDWSDIALTDVRKRSSQSCKRHDLNSLHSSSWQAQLLEFDICPGSTISKFPSRSASLSR